MKITFFISIFLFGLNTAISQNEISWCYKNNNSLYGESFENSLLIGKLLTTSVEESNYYINDSQLFANVVSNNMGQVYINIPNFYITDLLLYDFSLNIGDTMFYNWGGVYDYLYEFDHYKIVDEIDSILIDDVFRKVMYLQSYGGLYYESALQTWIEGYGSVTSTGFLNPLQTDKLLNGDDYTFNCVKENNTEIYSTQPCYCSLTDNIGELKTKKPQIYLKDNKILIEYSGLCEIRLMDVTGTVILNKKSNGFTEIGINSFSDGIYIINVSGDAYSYSQKVIIRR